VNKTFEVGITARGNVVGVRYVVRSQRIVWKY